MRPVSAQTASQRRLRTVTVGELREDFEEAMRDWQTRIPFMLRALIGDTTDPMGIDRMFDEARPLADPGSWTTSTDRACSR